MMNSWWKTYDLSEKGYLQNKIGPLWIGIKKLKDEWQIYYDHEDDWQDVLEETRGELSEFSFDTAPNKERFVVKGLSQKVSFIPALADRPFVTRPSTPFYIPSKQSAVIYVSTPLWVKVGIGEESLYLIEVPTIRPSDSWFGPNTIRGELCYASRTSARLSVDEIPKRFHRAITPIEIFNEAGSHLFLERINLPVPYLELYEIAGKYLWTQGVKIVREEEDEAASLEIIKGPPVQAASTAVHVSGPRNRHMQENIIRTISSSLFS